MHCPLLRNEITLFRAYAPRRRAFTERATRHINRRSGKGTAMSRSCVIIAGLLMNCATLTGLLFIAPSPTHAADPRILRTRRWS